MTSCGGCGRNIVSGTIVTALDASWHSACFVCGLCTRALDGPFYGCGGAPFCESCIDEAERLDAKGQLKPRGGGGAKQEEEEVPIAARSGGGGERSYSPPAPRAASPVHEPPPPVQQSSPPQQQQQSDGDEPTCRKCRRQILSGTIVNALLATWHESCFRCTACGGNLDAFYGHDSLPYCENCIDAAEEAPPVVSAAPTGPPSIANAFKPPAVSNAFGNQPASEPPKLAAVSTGGSSYSQLPVPQTHASWEERARVAEEQVRELYQKLSMVKVALAEERRISNEEYSELQGELQREKDRCEQLEKRLRERDRTSGTSNSEVEVINESLKREQARSRDLERELAQARSTAAAERSDDRLSSALLELEASQRQVRDLSSRLRDTENLLECARIAAANASSIPSSDNSFAGGGAPPPPPPPPGAPPPPPPMMMGGPLKITRTGQSAKTADAVEEHNPQADLISELKKGRPQLRRAAAQRPSKRELLTKAANARTAEQERPDPSIVKGADTSNPSARKMASAAEKTAVLAVERDDRVKTGQLKMKVHRNKFLDQFLDSEFK